LTEGLVSDGDRLDIAVDRREERTTVQLDGRLGIDTSPDLRDQLLGILRGQPPKTIIVDLTKVSSIDASGVATLLEALKLTRNRHATLCLKGLQGRTLRFLEVMGLLAVFEADCKGGPAELR
jgi:anti-anti-sigma factor